MDGFASVMDSLAARQLQLANERDRQKAKVSSPTDGTRFSLLQTFELLVLNFSYGSNSFYAAFLIWLWDFSTVVVRRYFLMLHGCSLVVPPQEEEDHPGPIFLRNVTTGQRPYKMIVAFITVFVALTIIVVISVVYSNS